MGIDETWEEELSVLELDDHFVIGSMLSEDVLEVVWCYILYDPVDVPGGSDGDEAPSVDVVRCKGLGIDHCPIEEGNRP